MKKTAARSPEEQHIAPQYGFRKLRPLKIPKAAWFALLLSLIMAISLFVLYGISFKGSGSGNKTLLIYSGGTGIPEVSLRNCLAAAGFGYENQQEHFNYLANWGMNVNNCNKVFDSVMKVAQFIYDGMESQLKNNSVNDQGE